MIVVDLFAGPGGWSHALSLLGIRDVGLEWDAWACKTRAAAGQLTLRTDVALYPVAPFVGKTSGFIASPPCQAWSMAGKRLGLVDQPLVHQAVADLARGLDTRAGLLSACRDERSLLAAEPMRYLYALNQAGEPEWVAMEEVPDVLPLWKQYAAILRGWGFSVWAGILNAADYGVPQTRRRAILLASRARTAEPPNPTHARVAEQQTLFGLGRARWVSMSEALGWGATDRPVPTVCAGGGPGGGPEPFPSGSRKALADARSRGTWKDHSALASVVPPSRHLGSEPTERHSAREHRHTHVPDSMAEAPRWSWSLRNNSQSHATVRRADEPAGTLFFGHRANECLWVPEPAPGASGAEVPVPESVRITAAEAGVLQTFPADYPWQGNKGQQFSQIGNAVPPRLAVHLLAPHVGKTLSRDDFTLAA